MPLPVQATASADPAALEAQVRALADRAELTDLAFRLAQWLDGRAQGNPQTLFADDVSVVTPGGTVSGRDAVVAQARVNHDLPTHHLIGNVLTSVDGDVAEITANLLAHFVRSEATPPGPTELGGRYHLGAARHDGHWLLTSVRAEPVWREE
jgi:hypothetical protein